VPVDDKVMRRSCSVSGQRGCSVHVFPHKSKTTEATVAKFRTCEDPEAPWCDYDFRSKMSKVTVAQLEMVWAWVSFFMGAYLVLFVLTSE